MKAKIVKSNGKFYIQFGNKFSGRTYLDRTMDESNDCFDYTWSTIEFVFKHTSFETIEDAEAKWEAYKAFKQRHKFIHKKIKPLK